MRNEEPHQKLNCQFQISINAQQIKQKLPANICTIPNINKFPHSDKPKYILIQSFFFKLF